MSRLSIYRGDDKSYNFTFKYENGLPVDITDWTIFFTVKENETDLDAVAKISKTVTSHTDPANGLSVVSVNDTDTDSLTPKEYYFDFQIKKDDGKIRTLVKGTYRVLLDITRRTS